MRRFETSLQRATWIVSETCDDMTLSSEERGKLTGMLAHEIDRCAKIAELVWDFQHSGAHGGEQANRTAQAIRRQPRIMNERLLGEAVQPRKSKA